MSTREPPDLLDKDVQAEADSLRNTLRNPVIMGQMEFGDSPDDDIGKQTSQRINRADSAVNGYIDRTMHNAAVGQANKARVSEIHVNADSENIPDIMREGLATQHEIGNSNGTYDPDYRTQWEEQTFGDSHFGGSSPIYGHMSEGHEGGWRHDSLQESYGDVSLNISRKQFAAHTTMVRGDSLGSAVTPHPITDPDPDTDSHTGNDYLYFHEAQVHVPPYQIGKGGYGVDSANINVSSQNRGLPNTAQKAAYEALTASGVPVTGTQEVSYVQEEMFPYADSGDPKDGRSVRFGGYRQRENATRRTQREAIPNPSEVFSSTSAETAMREVLENAGPLRGSLAQPERP